MSTLNVANISDGTDTVETGYVVNGSAKAWVNFNGTGTPAKRDSLNVSNIVDVDTGKYTIELSNSMANGDYSVGGFTTSTSPALLIHIWTAAEADIAESGWTLSTLIVSSTGGGGSARDATTVTAQFMGDLA